MGAILLWIAKALFLPIMKADDAHARWRDKELKEARQLSFLKSHLLCLLFPNLQILQHIYYVYS
jgi:hypothetical protein